MNLRTPIQKPLTFPSISPFKIILRAIFLLIVILSSSLSSSSSSSFLFCFLFEQTNTMASSASASSASSGLCCCVKAYRPNNHKHIHRKNNSKNNDIERVLSASTQSSNKHTTTTTTTTSSSTSLGDNNNNNNNNNNNDIEEYNTNPNNSNQTNKQKQTNKNYTNSTSIQILNQMNKKRRIKAKMERMKHDTSTAILEENNWMNIISSDNRGEGMKENADKIGKWVSTLLADIKGKLNTDDVSEKKYCIERELQYRNGLMLLQIMNIRGGGGGGGYGNDDIYMNCWNDDDYNIHHSYTTNDKNQEECLNNIVRYSSTEEEEKEEKGKVADMPLFDTLGRKVSLISAGIVLSQSILSFLVRDGNGILDELAMKLLSQESAFAMRTIRKIVKDFPEHGVVDVFSEYPTKDVIMSILALSRLQRTFYTINTSSSTGQPLLQENNNNRNRQSSLFHRLFSMMSLSSFADGDFGFELEEYKLMADLAHYSAFAHAAYGWKMQMLSGKIHMGDLETLLRKTGIEERHVIDTNWKSKTHLPAYFLVRDVHKKTIVLCIRGTLSAKDLLTDLCCTAEGFLSHEEEEEEAMLKQKEGEEKYNESETFQKRSVQSKYNYRAHQGMVQAARGVSKMTYEMIRSELDRNPDYKLVLVGHSLGGGVAAVLGTIWRDTFPGLNVFAFGCPCVAPLDCYPTVNENIVSIVGEGDPFSCLSLGHIADTSSALSKLCENEELRTEILNRTKTEINEMVKEDIDWCIDTLESLSIQVSADNTTEKFYPPGRVLHLKVKGGNFFRSNVNEVTLTEVKPQHLFRDLKLHPRMFDLSLHVPHRYEVLLSRVWSSLMKRI